jgi:ankyrin repeat protein
MKQFLTIILIAFPSLIFSGETLFDAAAGDNSAFIESYKGDFNATNEKGWTALMLASVKGQTNAVKALITAGADVNLVNRNSTKTAIQLAKNDSIIKLLREAGAKLTFAQEKLFNAAAEGDTNFIASYIARGGDINIQSFSGAYLKWTPLMFAVQSGREDAVKLLVAAGADVNIKEHNYYSSPLMCAVNGDYTNIIKLLIAAGADINAKDASGWTPLMHASSMGCPGAAVILIRAGADVNAVNNDGWSALGFAQWNKRMDLVEILEKAGAR